METYQTPFRLGTSNVGGRPERALASLGIDAPENPGDSRQGSAEGQGGTGHIDISRAGLRLRPSARRACLGVRARARSRAGRPRMCERVAAAEPGSRFLTWFMILAKDRSSSRTCSLEGASSINGSRCKASAEVLTSISQRPFVAYQPNLHSSLEPATGIEPVTCCLQNSCSAVELRRRR